LKNSDIILDAGRNRTVFLFDPEKQLIGLGRAYQALAKVVLIVSATTFAPKASCRRLCQLWPSFFLRADAAVWRRRRSSFVVFSQLTAIDELRFRDTGLPLCDPCSGPDFG
jgi:hypothetical protein